MSGMVANHMRSAQGRHHVVWCSVCLVLEGAKTMGIGTVH